MQTTAAPYIPVSRAYRSRLAGVDWDNLQPGAVSTDHMFICDFADGQWRDAGIVPFGPFSLSPTALVFHYGQTIFEGMKAFRTEDDRIHIFRPEKHYDRLTRTAERLCMPVLPRELFLEALRRLVGLERDWVPVQPGGALYLRPFQIATDNRLSVRVSDSYRFAIVCSPSGLYFAKPVRVKVEREYVRAVSGGTGFAKCGGNYGGALYPTELAKAAGYDQVLWTDGLSHSYVEESGMMNVFFVIGDTLVTPPLTDTILDGVTRDSLLKLAAGLGMPVEVRPVSVEELQDGLERRVVTEAFGAGTAAVVSPISEIGIDERDYVLPVVSGGVGDQLKQVLDDIRYGRRPDVHGWNCFV
ncbi:MAG TPA: branched-chain amino acid aminotransferase [Puia sp.]|jgi:branched-chain amino acid aminotransferase|nr:branched-chain amino acid aminotransferase [Puia sp.]